MEWRKRHQCTYDTHDLGRSHPTDWMRYLVMTWRTYPADGPNIDSSSRLFIIAVEPNLIGYGLLFWMDGFEMQLLIFPFGYPLRNRPALTKKVL